MNWTNPSLLQNRQKGLGGKDLSFSAEAIHYFSSSSGKQFHNSEQSTSRNGCIFARVQVYEGIFMQKKPPPIRTSAVKMYHKITTVLSQQTTNFSNMIPQEWPYSLFKGSVAFFCSWKKGNSLSLASQNFDLFFFHVFLVLFFKP